MTGRRIVKEGVVAIIVEIAAKKEEEIEIEIAERKRREKVEGKVRI